MIKNEKLRKDFEESFLQNTCFDDLDELLKDKTSIEVNAPRALIACNLQGAWHGFLAGYERGIHEGKSKEAK